ncbi:unnamed protein product [Rhizophagus irregularis]|uniref:Uncharacterized protein n=1 Tax=Rhizophagus irregularis TaxID=588596 RepID=A0A915ZKV5_9GLOM|nr:unnamed protein product [Rhizophagus irregularis]CAB5380399.1 unnamed protein product [Rhizophagus irregularis]
MQYRNCFTVLLIPFDIHLWILKDLYCLKFHKGAWQNHLESNLKTLLLWIFDLIIKDATQYIYNRIWDPIFPNGEELLKEILTRIKSHQFHAICLTVWICKSNPFAVKKKCFTISISLISKIPERVT